MVLYVSYFVLFAPFGAYSHHELVPEIAALLTRLRIFSLCCRSSLSICCFGFSFRVTLVS